MLPKESWNVAPEDMPDLESALKPIVASAASRKKYWNYWQCFCNEMKISKKEGRVPTGADVVEYFKIRMEAGVNSNALSQQWCALRKAMEVMYANSLNDVRAQVQEIIGNARYLERDSGGTAVPKRLYKKKSKHKLY